MDDLSLPTKILQTARNTGATLATAESCTGGLIAAALTEMPGSSDVFDRGFVTYSNAAKMTMLDVPAAMLDTYGAVSLPVAGAMATGALAHSDATISVSVTGIAGPGGSDHKPEGRVCFGLAKPGADPWCETVEFGPLGRHAVRRASVQHALKLLLQHLS